MISVYQRYSREANTAQFLSSLSLFEMIIFSITSCKLTKISLCFFSWNSSRFIMCKSQQQQRPNRQEFQMLRRSKLKKNMFRLHSACIFYQLFLFRKTKATSTVPHADEREMKSLLQDRDLSLVNSHSRNIGFQGLFYQ